MAGRVQWWVAGIPATKKRRSGMSIRPLGRHVVVRRLDSDPVSAGGLVIPETAKETSQRATVVAVGRGRLNDHGVRLPLQVKKGDRVLVRRFAGTEIEIRGREHLVVDEDDILGILDGSDASRPRRV